MPGGSIPIRESESNMDMFSIYLSSLGSIPITRAGKSRFQLLEILNSNLLYFNGISGPENSAVDGSTRLATRAGTVDDMFLQYNIAISATKTETDENTR